jgi:hypothetical protein
MKFPEAARDDCRGIVVGGEKEQNVRNTDGITERDRRGVVAGKRKIRHRVANTVGHIGT